MRCFGFRFERKIPPKKIGREISEIRKSIDAQKYFSDCFIFEKIKLVQINMDKNVFQQKPKYLSSTVQTRAIEILGLSEGSG